MSETKRYTGIDKTADKVRGVADRAADRLQDRIDAARGAVHGVVNAASGRASRVASLAENTFDSVTQGPKRFAGSGAAMIRDNPFTALGLALAVGYLVGRLSR